MRLFESTNFTTNRRVQIIAAFAMLMIAGVIALFLLSRGVRQPPNIFDTPVDGVLDFLADEGFNAMSVEERLAFLQNVVKRFRSMSQTESAVASAFLAGLTGPANEQLVSNARVLGKDILVQGAQQYLALKTEAERRAFLDQWLLQWVRYGEEATGRRSSRTPDEILKRMQTDAQRDIERQGADIPAVLAQQAMDFWERDVASVATPREQAMIFQFLPALRAHILMR